MSNTERHYICHPCGVKYGTPGDGVATARKINCDWCGKEDSCLPKRHYKL